MSVGKIEIKKVVDFVPLKTKNFMNMGFGDLLPDGSIDDTVSSNNGDIIKVLTTVVFRRQHKRTYQVVYQDFKNVLSFIQ